MITTASVFLSLFALSTLVSQSAMAVFSTLFGLVFLLLLAVNPDYRRHALRRTGLEVMAGLWFLVTALSLWQGADLVEVPQWQKLFDFKWLIFAVAIGRHLSFIRLSEKTLLMHWNFFSLACLWAIAIFFLGYDPLHPGQKLDLIVGGSVRTGGFLQQAIVFAQLYALWLMIPLGILIYSLPDFLKLRARPFIFASLADAAVWGTLAIVLSFTRGAWMAIALASVICLAMRNWLWAIMGAVLSGFSILGLTLVWETLQLRLTQAFQGGDSERSWIWAANWKMFTEHPWLGVGYNHNVQLAPKYYELIEAPTGVQVSHAHSQFLQILTGTGVLGLLVYLGFWITVFAAAFSVFRGLKFKENQNANLHAGIALGVLGAILAFTFGGFFESNLEHSKMRWTLSLVVGLLIWLKDLRQKDQAV